MYRYGLKSFMYIRYTDTYADPRRCGESSIVWTRPPGGRPGGVTFFHVLPLSFVTQTGPSFDPVQKTPGSSREDRIEYSAAYTSSPVISRVIGSPEVTWPSAVFAVTSGLNFVQCTPPSTVLWTYCDP